MTRLQLIYIHGFQGDHTSFQAFPTDLHKHLRSRLPSGIRLESWLYLSKSRRPISEAAIKFIDWLSSQPYGQVILLGHSMGGLLAAEIATSKSRQAKRIIGLVSFDVPFLGMHPHVIISGIASLLPSDKESEEKTEAELNDWNIVERIRAVDFEKSEEKSIDSLKTTRSLPPSQRPSPHSTTSVPSKVKEEWIPMKKIPASSAPTSLSPSQSSSPRPYPSFLPDADDEAIAMEKIRKAFAGRGVHHRSLSTSEVGSTGSSSTSSQSQNSLSLYGPSLLSARSSSTSLASSSSSTSWWSPEVSSSTRRSPSITAKLERAGERVVEWHNLVAALPRRLSKRAEDPLNAMATWIVEHFQFGVCMFDPIGLRERYKALEAWDGQWINIWTEAPAKSAEGGTGGTTKALEEDDKDVRGALPSNTADVVRIATAEKRASDSDLRSHAKARKAAEKALRKERKKERKPGSSSARPARHFIVLPDVENARTKGRRFGSLERWERFPIQNVDDEVEAHCGLFIRSKNPRYENLVERVADVIMDWSKSIQ